MNYASNNKDCHITPFFHYFSFFTIFACISWSVLPMLVLRENYFFTIVDGLDSYAGIVQNIHDNGLYFHLNHQMPFLHGLEGKYTLLSYNLYDFLNCVFGFVPGQILTRIIGIVLGFFSMRRLLGIIVPADDQYRTDMINLLSTAYIVTPIAPNRMIGFASLPAVILLFIRLLNAEEKSKLVLISILIPILSIFDSVLVFTVGLWFIASIVIQYKQKKLDWNLNLSFILQCVSTVLVNWNFFEVAFSASSTTRELSYGSNSLFSFDLALFKSYLLNGQFHSTANHKMILLPFLILTTILASYRFRVRPDLQKKKYLILLISLWGFWIITALVKTIQECGFRTGLLLIDGFQWGRSVGLMRIGWYIMFGCVLLILDYSKFWKAVMFCTICLQLIYVSCTPTIYNDTMASLSMYKQLLLDGDTNYISYKEFMATDLFSTIKHDINYTDEGVAAYGFHPSVLISNGFSTLDGYETVHSMEWQKGFREIIKPALDTYPNYKDYYDGWGGRMYLYGELEFEPTRNKPNKAFPLYINTEAFKKYGGTYILSRAKISNSDALNLELIKDYDSSDSIYHIWLYKAYEQGF